MTPERLRNAGAAPVHSAPRPPSASIDRGFGAALSVVGHVTRDIVDGAERIGGAAAYAALAAAELGVSTRLVTSAPAKAPLLSALEHERIELCIQDSKVMTTFELRHAGAVRRLWVHARAEPLSENFLQRAAAPLVYVGPVIDEVDIRLLGCLASSYLVLGLQGWLRQLAPEGEVQWAEPESLAELPPDADVVFSEADHPDADALARKLRNDQRVVLVTRGARGVSAWYAGCMQHVAGTRANEREPTGAGDVFGVVFALGRHFGDSVEHAIGRAQLAAARSVEGPGLGNLAAAKLALGFGERA